MEKHIDNGYAQKDETKFRMDVEVGMKSEQKDCEYVLLAELVCREVEDGNVEVERDGEVGYSKSPNRSSVDDLEVMAITLLDPSASPLEFRNIRLTLTSSTR